MRYTALATLAIIATLSGLSGGFFTIELLTRSASAAWYGRLYWNGLSLALSLYGISRCRPKAHHPRALASPGPVLACVTLSTVALYFGLMSEELWR